VLGDIWLGDAVRVLALLRPHEEEFVAAMRALGLQAPENRVRAPTTPPSLDESAEDERDLRSETDSHASAPVSWGETQPQAESQPIQPKPDQAGAVEVPLLEPSVRETVTPTRWDVAALPLPGPENVTPVLPYESLFAPRSTAAILQSLVSRIVEGGDIDTDTLIEIIADGRPIDRLPRRQTRTLRFGVELLVDLSEGMQPFRRDQVEIVESVRRLAGREQTKVAYFADAPLRGAGSGVAWTWEAYRPPNPKTRLIVLSDLGIGGPPLSPRTALPEEWLQFVEQVQQHDCDVIAVVPYPRHRWPAAISSVLPILQWDRVTTTGVAFQAVGPS